MFPLRNVLFVFLVTILSQSGYYVFCDQIDNGTASRSPSRGERQHKQQSDVLVNGNSNAPSSFSISPSFSYQFHTNDHEHLDQIVSAHQNLVAGDGSGASGNSRFSSVNQDKDLSASRRADSASSRKDVPPISSSFYSQYPASVYSRKQQEKVSGAQRTRETERKQERQFQPHHQSVPQAVSPNNYMSPKVNQVERTSKNGTGTDSLQGGVRQKRILQQNSNPSWNPIVKGNGKASRNSSSFVYSLPLKNRPLSNGKPLTYQRQLQQHYTAGSYSNTNLKRKVTSPSSATRDAGKQPYSTTKVLQSRADEYETPEETQDDKNEVNDETSEAYEHDHSEHDHDHEYYSPLNNFAEEDNDQPPELRDFGLPPHDGGFGGGPFFAGDPLGGPLPPPPPPLKGSVDYILIPLILIGLAGPIFVVLYVILGSFEARLSPIQRSLNDYSEYKPYIDTITSSVGRALETYECFDYAVCRFSGFSSQLGLSDSTTASIESAVTAVTPKEYLPTVRSLISVLKKQDPHCNKYKCSNMVDQIPFKF